MEIKIRYGIEHLHYIGNSEVKAEIEERIMKIEGIEQNRGFGKVDSDSTVYRDLWTGLVDKNGKEIYENDVVDMGYRDVIGIIKFGEYSNDDYYENYGNGWYIQTEEGHIRAVSERDIEEVVVIKRKEEKS